MSEETDRQTMELEIKTVCFSAEQSEQTSIKLKSQLKAVRIEFFCLY
jgi:hypothetical protein